MAHFGKDDLDFIYDFYNRLSLEDKFTFLEDCMRELGDDVKRGDIKQTNESK